MIRMTLTQEVDATPEQVQEALIAWRDRQAGVQFPFAPGEFCRLSETSPGAWARTLTRRCWCWIAPRASRRARWRSSTSRARSRQWPCSR